MDHGINSKSFYEYGGNTKNTWTFSLETGRTYILVATNIDANGLPVNTYLAFVQVGRLGSPAIHPLVEGTYWTVAAGDKAITVTGRYAYDYVTLLKL